MFVETKPRDLIKWSQREREREREREGGGEIALKNYLLTVNCLAQSCRVHRNQKKHLSVFKMKDSKSTPAYNPSLNTSKHLVHKPNL